MIMSLYFFQQDRRKQGTIFASLYIQFCLGCCRTNENLSFVFVLFYLYLALDKANTCETSGYLRILTTNGTVSKPMPITVH